jgi:hypothetical protein
MPFEKGKQGYTHETPWISGKGVKSTKRLPPALIKAFNGLTAEGKAFGLLCERLALDDLFRAKVQQLAKDLPHIYTHKGN